MSKKVMLAHPYEEDKHKSKVNGWFISIKYDGVRGFWDGNVMKSRTNKKNYTLPVYIIEQLKLFKEDGKYMQLDGEIWFGNNTFALASGSARKEENDLEVWKHMKYMIFDIPDTTLPFEQRLKKLESIFKKLKGKIPNIECVKHTKFDASLSTIDNELELIEKEGGEGIILRKPGSMYVFDRSHEMLKVKSWIYKEATVIGYFRGKKGSKYQKMVGSLIVRSDDFYNEDTDEQISIEFKVGSGLTDWQRHAGNGDWTEGDKEWKKKEIQTSINDARLIKKKEEPSDEEFRNIMNIIETKHGKMRNDALHRLNELYATMPCIGDVITFRYKELTQKGHPSFPTFVCVRDYE